MTQFVQVQQRGCLAAPLERQMLCYVSTVNDASPRAFPDVPRAAQLETSPVDRSRRAGMWSPAAVPDPSNARPLIDEAARAEVAPRLHKPLPARTQPFPPLTLSHKVGGSLMHGWVRLNENRSMPNCGADAAIRGGSGSSGRILASATKRFTQSGSEHDSCVSQLDDGCPGAGDPPS